MKRLFFVLMAFFLACGIALADTEVDNQTEVKQSQGFEYAPQSNGNVSIGGFPYPGAMGSQLPETSFHPSIIENRWNGSPYHEVFSAFPSTITSIHVEINKKNRKNRIPEDELEKEEELIITTATVLEKHDPTGAVMPFNRYPDPKIAKEGVHYTKMGRLITRVTEEELKFVSMEDLAMMVAEEAMSYGADVIIPTSADAKMIFASSSNTFSILGVASNILTHINPYGFSINPGGSHAKGANWADSMPYIRVSMIKFKPEHRAQAILAFSGLPESGIYTQLMNCPNAVHKNGVLRIGACELELTRYLAFISDKDKNEALVKAMDHLRQALKDNLEEGRAIRLAQIGRAVIYKEMTGRVSVDKENYLRMSEYFAAKAQYAGLPDINGYIQMLRTSPYVQ